jgi:hypothetical protein
MLKTEIFIAYMELIPMTGSKGQLSVPINPRRTTNGITSFQHCHHLAVFFLSGQRSVMVLLNSKMILVKKFSCANSRQNGKIWGIGIRLQGIDSWCQQKQMKPHFYTFMLNSLHSIQDIN